MRIETPVNADLAGQHLFPDHHRDPTSHPDPGPGCRYGGTLPHERIAICHVRGIAPPML